MKMTQNYAGIILALLATFLWSANFLVARGFSDVITPVTLAFFRWLIAFIVLFPFAIKAFLKQKKIIKKNFLFFLVTAILGVSIFNTMIYIAGKTTTATNMSLIAITAPVFIVIISRVFFKEKFPLMSTLGIILTFIGIILLIGKGKLSIIFELKFMQGDLLMVLAAICFATYSVIMKKKPKGVDITVLLLVTIFIGLIFLFPFYIYDLIYSAPTKYSLNIILSLLYIGVVNSVICFYCWNKAVLLIGSQEAGMIYYLLPVFSSSLAMMILKEKLHYYHIISFLLILSGIYIAGYFKIKQKKKLTKL